MPGSVPQICTIQSDSTPAEFAFRQCPERCVIRGVLFTTHSDFLLLSKGVIVRQDRPVSPLIPAAFQLLRSSHELCCTYATKRISCILLSSTSQLLMPPNNSDYPDEVTLEEWVKVMECSADNETRERVRMAANDTRTSLGAFLNHIRNNPSPLLKPIDDETTEEHGT